MNEKRARVLALAEELLSAINALSDRAGSSLNGQPCRLCGRTEAPALRNGAAVKTKGMDVGGIMIPLCLACEHSNYVTKTLLPGKHGAAEWLAKRLVKLSQPYDPKRPYGSPPPRKAA